MFTNKKSCINIILILVQLLFHKEEIVSFVSSQIQNYGEKEKEKKEEKDKPCNTVTSIRISGIIFQQNV